MRVGLTDLALNRPARSSSGARMCFLTYDTRDHAIAAWNAIADWWFHAAGPAQQSFYCPLCSLHNLNTAFRNHKCEVCVHAF